MKNTLAELQESLQGSLDIIREHCTSCNETISVAESVTSGFLQLLISTAQGAQGFFQGGITVYNNAQKAMHLHIEPIYAEKTRGVDPGITSGIAQNVCRLFNSQIGIGITGFATKVAEEGILELYAHIAIVRLGKVVCHDKIEAKNEGINAQWEYAAGAIHMLAQCMNHPK